jgi:phage tail-like protein
MMLAEAPERTERVTLRVEAGGTVETTFEVSAAHGVGAIDMHTTGLPAHWFELSVPQVIEAASDRARVRLVVHPPRLEHGGRPGIYDLDLDGVEAIPSRWRVEVVLPGTEFDRGESVLRSRLLEYLPRHYRTDEFLSRFLLIFQAALDPIEQAIDNTHLLLDPGLTPPALLEWLGQWLDLDLTSIPDVATRRLLIERAVELYRWKGTRRGLRTELALRFESPALIVENFDGLRLGHDAALGVNTHLGRRCDNCVVITLGGPAAVDADMLDRADELVDATRPAGCGYVLRPAPTAHAHGHAEVVDHG